MFKSGHKPKIINVDDAADETHAEHLPANSLLTTVELVAIGDLKRNPRAAKKHSAKKISLLSQNIKKFGFTQPIIVDENNVILAGLARYLAARESQHGLLKLEASADKAYVGGLEREEQNPTIDMLERLAKVLGADIAEFFAKVPKGAPRPKPLPAGRKAALKPGRKKQ